MCHVAFSFSTQNSLQYAVGLPDSCRNLVLGKPSTVCSARKILAIVVWSSAPRLHIIQPLVRCSFFQSVFLFPGNDTYILFPNLSANIDFHVPETFGINQFLGAITKAPISPFEKLQIFHFFKLPCSPFQQSYNYQYLWWTEGVSGERKDRNGPLGFPSWRFWTWDETYSEFAPMKRWQNWGEVSFSKQQFSGVMWWLFQSYLNVPSDKQMSKRWPFSLLNDEQRVAKRLGV